MDKHCTAAQRVGRDGRFLWWKEIFQWNDLTQDSCCSRPWKKGSQVTNFLITLLSVAKQRPTRKNIKMDLM